MNAGLVGAYADPEPQRNAGSHQSGSFPAHSHKTLAILNGYPRQSGDRYGPGFNYLIHPKYPKKNNDNKGYIETNSTGAGSDNRPDNVAVYYYIFVGDDKSQ
jgi:hypothetical protein